jgi:WhiB family redox-sensing transcriptional regulator
MGEITSANNRWRKGGATLTLEEWRRQTPQPPKAPSRGTPIDTGAERPQAETDWRERARCRIDKKRVDWFFPEMGDQSATVRITRYCAGCDVRAECRAFAIETGLWVGWYGGESPKMRSQTAGKWSGPDRAHGTPSRAQYGARGFDKTQGCLCRECVDAWAASRAKEAERNRRNYRAQRAKLKAARS